MLLVIFLTACSHPQPNSVYEYFKEVDLQCETKAQKESISEAFEDMLILPSKDLQQKLYSDYQSNPSKWTAFYLIERYFVPHKQGVFINAEKFYQELEDPEVKRVLLDWVKRLQKEIHTYRE